MPKTFYILKNRQISTQYKFIITIVRPELNRRDIRITKDRISPIGSIALLMRQNVLHIDVLVKELAFSDSQQALKSLYLFYFDKLLHWADFYVNNQEDAEEIVSDSFLAVWESRASLSEVRDFDAYIYKLVRNKAISVVRSRRSVNVDIENPYVELLINTEISPEDQLIEREIFQKIDNAIDALPEKRKQIFKMVRDEHMKYRDIADHLQISVKTVEAQMAIGIKNIRKILL